MNDKEIRSIVEALLFIWGDPLSLKDISKILEIEEHHVKKILDQMMDEFNYNRRGLKIVRTKNNYQLTTRPEHYQWISKLSQEKNKKNLSTAALETLSIIAYKQPITKSEIGAIRGVRSDKAIETLLNKDLIKEKGRLDRTGRPIIYGTTDEFLKYFGLDDLDDLPDINNFDIESTEIERKGE
ncbi:SMC-Scp complex subunit ScpB [Schnuerera sp. xch1]|uniref:SMC-Scp complex subunit ScpB n=1 Tax=Schnuerera sp. xch1 TaxID=2874283 RepID=UPI001CC06FA6|nr:SMC-Scp complex subunit ScpB [Schnuerera sp. xch1]MBZ2173776.1 SMC-Scp complex subunit ScpB [Schnuerera sp. xch1]